MIHSEDEDGDDENKDETEDEVDKDGSRIRMTRMIRIV